VTPRTQARLQIWVRRPTVPVVTPDLASPSLLQLRLLSRRLDADLARMDARVNVLLRRPGPPSDADVAAIDVLCAAIAEVRELQLEARADAAGAVAARRERRTRPKRWV
jgi:hypothetical protein